MKNNKANELLEALKEYNKTLAEQIKRMKTFIEDIDKQLNYHKKIERNFNAEKINKCFSRQYLLDRATRCQN